MLRPASLIRASAFAALLGGATLVPVQSFAYPDSEARILFNEGVAALDASDTWLARQRFGYAMARARQAKDWEVLVQLPIQYLLLANIDPGYVNDNTINAQSSFVEATSICYDLAIYNANRSGSGEDCPEGLNGCAGVVAMFDNNLSLLPPGSLRDSFAAQADIARGIICDPSPFGGNGGGGNGGGGGGNGGGGGGNGGGGAFNDPNIDKAFGAAQYLVHAIKHSSYNGDVDEDTWFLFPNKPDERGSLTLPDGSGGTYWRLTDYVAGPFETPRGVCGAAQGRGVANGSFSAWNHNWSFGCGQTAGSDGNTGGTGGGSSDECADNGWYGDGEYCDECPSPDPDCGGGNNSGGTNGGGSYDECAANGWYGDGEYCDECPSPDPDCGGGYDDGGKGGGGGYDECADNGWYGDGECDTFCASPDPDCSGGGDAGDDGSEWYNDDGGEWSDDGNGRSRPDRVQDLPPGCTGGSAPLGLLSALAALLIIARRRTVA